MLVHIKLIIKSPASVNMPLNPTNQISRSLCQRKNILRGEMLKPIYL